MEREVKKIYYFIIISVILVFINTPSYLVNTVIYSIAVVPLAILLGELTSEISNFIGEKKGGLLSATIGNMPELMMGIGSIKYNMITMVKSALIGSIINNMLLVLGISIFLGGVKYREQKFNRMIARTNFGMLLLAMSAMIVMATLNSYSDINDITAMSISFKMSIVLMLVYILGLVFSLYTHSNLFVVSEEEEEVKKDSVLKRARIIGGIAVSTILLYFISDKLILNISELVNNYGLSQQFFGIMFMPLLGNIGENFSAIMCAMKNKINLSLEIAIGSSIQIALFVTPLLILFSSFTIFPMTFLFTNFQIIMSALAIGMSFFVFQDGKTYWLEGAILMAIYIMIILAYYHI